MTPITEFIVQIEKSHKDEVALKSGLTLKVDTRFNQGVYTNRVGKVIACPAKYDSKIKEGYIVVIDKNIVTFQVHGDSLINKSMNLVDEKLGYYRVPESMIYLYKENAKSDWVCPAPYIFIRPIKSEVTKTKGGLEYKAIDDYKGFKEQYGTVAYINDIAKSYGLKLGDLVFYPKDREYEFDIDGEILYHMDNSDILGIMN